MTVRGYRIQRNVSVVRIYEHDPHYEARRKWLQQYGELMSVNDRRTDSDGCFIIVPNKVADAFERAFPEEQRAA